MGLGKNTRGQFNALHARKQVKATHMHTTQNKNWITM